MSCGEIKVGDISANGGLCRESLFLLTDNCLNCSGYFVIFLIMISIEITTCIVFLFLSFEDRKISDSSWTNHQRSLILASATTFTRGVFFIFGIAGEMNPSRYIFFSLPVIFSFLLVITLMRDWAVAISHIEHFHSHTRELMKKFRIFGSIFVFCGGIGTLILFSVIAPIFQRDRFVHNWIIISAQTWVVLFSVLYSMASIFFGGKILSIMDESLAFNHDDTLQIIRKRTSDFVKVMKLFSAFGMMFALGFLIWMVTDSSPEDIGMNYSTYVYIVFSCLPEYSLVISSVLASNRVSNKKIYLLAPPKMSIREHHNREEFQPIEDSLSL